MNLFSRFEQDSSFSPAERALADYLLIHGDELRTMTISQLELECPVSRAVIYRFITKCGFSGFLPFRIALQADYQSWIRTKEGPDASYPFKAGDSSSVIASRLLEDISLSLQTASNLMEPAVLDQAAAGLDLAERILVFASAGNLPVCRSFQFQMAEIGKTVLVPEDEYEQRLLAASADEKDFVIVVSFAGRGKLASSLMKLFASKKLNWLLISSAALKEANPRAPLHLVLPDQEHHADRISGFGIRSSLLYVFDVLYSVCYALHYQEYAAYKRRQYAILRTL